MDFRHSDNPDPFTGYAGPPPGYTERELNILREIAEASDILAEALGYRHDDEYGWATGDHTVVSLAMEVRSRGVKEVTP